MSLSRRNLLAGAAATGAAASVPLLAPAAGAVAPAGSAAPAVVRRGRPLLPSGIASGDVTPSSAGLWSRTDRRARMLVELTDRGRSDRTIRLRGPVTGPDADFTAQLPLRGLRPGQRYDYRITFEDAQGLAGQSAAGSFRTPGRGPVSFVWTGDTAGQGWGINPERGGMTAYRAKLSHGPLLDVFCLDMRTFREANPAPGAAATPILGTSRPGGWSAGWSGRGRPGR